jgi:hypothetical protein
MMRELAEKVVAERLRRLHWVEGLGAPLVAGHMPAEVVGEQTEAEREWFALARKVTIPEHDHVVLPPFSFDPRK